MVVIEGGIGDGIADRVGSGGDRVGEEVVDKGIICVERKDGRAVEGLVKIKELNSQWLAYEEKEM